MATCKPNRFCYRKEDYAEYVWREYNGDCEQEAKRKVTRSGGTYYAAEDIQKGELLDLDPAEHEVKDTTMPKLDDVTDKKQLNKAFDHYTILRRLDKTVNVRILNCTDGPYYEARRDIRSGEELSRYYTPASWLLSLSSNCSPELLEDYISKEKNIAPEGYFDSVPEQVEIKTRERSTVTNLWRKVKRSQTLTTILLILGGLIILVVLGLAIYYTGDKLLSLGVSLIGYLVFMYLNSDLGN